MLRIPNYFTVPGDVLAGFALAGGAAAPAWALAWTVVLSVCLYATGILLNDLADIEEDARERPGRPLPAGEIRPNAAWAAMVVLILVCAGLATGPAQASLMPAAGLGILIVLYDLWLKRMPVLGEASIAGCRFLNLVLGACLAPGSPLPAAVIAGGAIVWSYVFGLSFVARHETSTGLARRVGALVRGLVFVQALLIAAGGRPAMAAAVAALWIPATLLGRRFYSS